MIDHARKWVVARRWTGLGDSIVSLLAAHRYALATSRSLVVDWRFSPYSVARTNVFSTVFEPTEQWCGVPMWDPMRVDAFLPEGPFWPVFWDHSSLHAPPLEGERGDAEEAREIIAGERSVEAPVVVFDNCLDASLPSIEACRARLTELRVRDVYVAAAHDFSRSHFQGRPVVGVHVRHGNGGDIMDHTRFWMGPELASVRILRAIERVRARVRATAATDPIVFLCTDSPRVEHAIRQSFADLLTRPKVFREAGAGELHMWGEAAVGLGDAVVEMLLLAKTDVLVRFPPSSFFSFWGACMKAPPLLLGEEVEPPGLWDPQIC